MTAAELIAELRDFNGPTEVYVKVDDETMASFEPDVTDLHVLEVDEGVDVDGATPVVVITVGVSND